MALPQFKPDAVNEIAKAVRTAALPVSGPEDVGAFASVFAAHAEPSLVLLGEASHGTSEFYHARATITRFLIEHHGFRIVAVEADWPDAARIDRYVRHRSAEVYDQASFARFPTWMWRNHEVADFVEWLWKFNGRVPATDQAEFRGLDVYSLHTSAEAVIDYLDNVDPEKAALARERYACLTPWHSRPSQYGRAVLAGEDSCEEGVVRQLQELLAHQLEYSASDGDSFFDATQNARIVRAAEQYYRMMYRGSVESWNLRDRHMFETLQRLIETRGENAKAVVWAHNSHVGDASATEMGCRGEFNIGELCRKARGSDMMAIGFGTDRGTVAAADAWERPMQVKTVLPSRPDSYERVFHQARVPSALLDLGETGDLQAREALSAPRLERAIGVVYRPDTELQSHYFEAVLPEQFDAYYWIEQTRAVTPLPSQRPQGVPDTYPFGV